MNKIIQSNDSEIDTLKCPKCGALWRAKVYYDYDEGGFVHNYEEEFCPCGCQDLLGHRIEGTVVTAY